MEEITMKKHIACLIGVLTMALFSCTENFEEINTSPNRPEVAPATNLFGYSIQSIAQRFGQTEIFYPGAFVGYTAKGTYNLVNRYAEVAPASHWNNLFTYGINNLNAVIKEADATGNNNLKAAAMVMRAYAFQLLVDAYGPVPYHESGRLAEKIVYPQYDSEKEIYSQLISSLKTANSLFNSSTTQKIGVGDLIYGGNVSRWKKFCNSLRLRMSIRLSKAEPTLAQSNISEILNDANTYPVFTSNADNALLRFPGADWLEPWASAFKAVPDIKIARPIVSAMNSLNDPRLPFYAQPNAAGKYVGLEVGADASGSNESKVSKTFMETDAGIVFFQKYCEVEFIRAEAAKLGYINSSAQSAYNNAIKASFDEYAIPASAYNSYIADPAVAWNDYLPRLYSQKWIALFRQCWEAWAEMRRTDVPQNPPAINASYAGHNRTPFRLSYPVEERNLNPNVPSGVTEKDMFWGYQIWWDKRTGVQ
jgi:hypothetical protein